MQLRLLAGSTTTIALALAPWIATAQPAQGAGQQGQGLSARPAQGTNPGTPQTAQQCLRELTAFGRQMQNEGFWLSGYRRGYGWGNYGLVAPESRVGMAAPPAPAGTAPAGHAQAGAGASPAGNTPVQSGGANAGPQQPSPTGPWGDMNWSMAPGQEIGILYNAAAVLAHRGKEQACESVLDALKSTYAEDARQMRQAGVQPNQVETYRRQQLARAQPVAQASHAFRADAITGTDVRNPQDQDLGSIEDVVLDPKTGQVSYAIIARGGFLGIGDEHVAVPWPRLKVAPNMDVFVLDTSPETLGQAPQVNPDSFASAQNFERRRQEIDKFWQQQAGKAG